MHQKYDYQKKIREVEKESEYERLHMTPEEKEAQQLHIREKMNETLERYEREYRPMYRIKNEKKYKKFLKDVEIMKELARNLDGILEINIDEKQLTAYMKLSTRCIIHISDECSRNTRYLLSYLMLNYDNFYISPEGKDVVYFIGENLFEEIPAELIPEHK